MATISTTPGDPSAAIGLVHDRALAAERATDWIAAEAFWRVAIAREPSLPAAHRGLAKALRQQDRLDEAEAVLHASVSSQAVDIECLIALTELAELKQDPYEAVRLWQTVRLRFPDDVRGYLGNAEVARFVLSFDEVTAVLSEALYRFPREPLVWTRYAEWMENRGNWPEAERAWRGLLAMDASRQSWHVGLARAMLRQGRHDEAEALLSRQSAEYPDEVAYAIARARSFEAVADWQSALSRWGHVVRRFPDHAVGHSGVVRSLRSLDRPREAAVTLREGLTRFPGDTDLSVESAHLAREAGMIDVALLAWDEVRAKFPDLREAYVEPAEILLEQRRFDAAEELLAEAVHRFQTDATVLRARAELARARGGEASGEDTSLRDLGFAFESLGGTGPLGGCEFGMVQLHFGANPLSLLRWAAVSAASLIAGLNARFQGIEDKEAGDLFLNPDDPGHFWWVRDRRYDIEMHGFLSAKEVSRELALGPYRKRLSYLRDKLIGDLEAGEKIFILKHANRQMTAEEIDGVSQASRAFDAAVLLCVCPADAAHPEGGLVRRATNLWTGHIDFSNTTGIEGRMPAWRALCESMLCAVRRD